MQTKPFIVRYQQVYIQTLTVRVFGNSVDEAQQTVSDTLEQDMLGFDDGLCQVVGEVIVRSMSRFIVTSDDASSSLVTVFDVHPKTASLLDVSTQSVSDRRETGDLASVVLELDWTAQDFSRTR